MSRFVGWRRKVLRGVGGRLWVLTITTLARDGAGRKELGESAVEDVGDLQGTSATMGVRNEQDGCKEKH